MIIESKELEDKAFSQEGREKAEHLERLNFACEALWNRFEIARAKYEIAAYEYRVFLGFQENLESVKKYHENLKFIESLKENGEN